MARLPSAMAVRVLQWPAESGLRSELRVRAVPLLWRVAPGARPPQIDDELEDWVREPADSAELALRCRRLGRLAASTPPGPRLALRRRAQAAVPVAPQPALGPVLDRVGPEARRD